MAPTLWTSQLTARIASALRSARTTAGMTMAGVAAACAERGHEEMTAQTIKNLETGRKTSLSVADLLVLADVVGVPPVLLLFPLDGTEEEVEVLPHRTASPWDGLAWFTGEGRHSAAPSGEHQEVLDLYRAHDDVLAAVEASIAMATARRRAAETALDPTLVPGLQERARSYEALSLEDRKDLRAHRDRMRARGLTPPPLPADLQHVYEAALAKDQEATA
ncbi:helix-turn-helix domain-containing protein [Streptomyces sp. NPDC002248]